MGRQVSGDSKLGWALEVVLTKANRGGVLLHRGPGCVSRQCSDADDG